MVHVYLKGRQEKLAQKLAPLGILVQNAENGVYITPLGSDSHIHLPDGLSPELVSKVMIQDSWEYTNKDKLGNYRLGCALLDDDATATLSYKAGSNLTLEVWAKTPQDAETLYQRIRGHTLNPYEEWPIPLSLQLWYSTATTSIKSKSSKGKKRRIHAPAPRG